MRSCRGRAGTIDPDGGAHAPAAHRHRAGRERFIPSSNQGKAVHAESNLPTFEELYEAYAGRILNIAYRLCGNEETARDLTQDIFLKVYRNLGSFEEKSHIYTWIYRIAINHIMNHLKKERRQRWFNLMDMTVSDLVHQEDVEPAFRGQTHPPAADAAMEAAERANVVWKTIQSLPAKYRVPLVLHHYEEMTYQEIADAMGLSISAVETRIHRAKKQLIEKLAPLLGHL
jgi:RNA polymerase sigma-70 factor (ECF subfamily)